MSQRRLRACGVRVARNAVCCVVLSGSYSMKPRYTSGRFLHRTIAGTSSGSIALRMTRSVSIMGSTLRCELDDGFDHSFDVAVSHIGVEGEANQSLADLLGHRPVRERLDPLTKRRAMQGLVVKNGKNSCRSQMVDQRISRHRGRHDHVEEMVWSLAVVWHERHPHTVGT